MELFDASLIPHRTQREEAYFKGVQLIELGRLAHMRNFLAACDGNLSFRIGEYLVMTPSQKSKALLTVHDLTLQTLDGTPLKGRATSEGKIHRQIYDQCPEASAVIHAHPPHTVAWTLGYPKQSELPSSFLPESIIACGSIPIIPYHLPGTHELAEALQPHLPERRVLILERHGAVAWGDSLHEAFAGIERVEHMAQVLLLAFGPGKPEPLTAAEVLELRELRHKIGNRTL